MKLRKNIDIKGKLVSPDVWIYKDKLDIGMDTRLIITKDSIEIHIKYKFKKNNSAEQK